MINVHVGTSTAGVTLDASDPGFYAESNRPTFLQIHRSDPVYWVDAKHTQPFWNVCHHDLIREIGQDCELFTTEFGVHLNAAAFDVKTSDDQPSGGLTADLPVALRPANVLDAENHRRVRNPVNPHFRPRAVLVLETAIRREVRSLLDGNRAGAGGGLHANIRYTRTTAGDDPTAWRQYRPRA